MNDSPERARIIGRDDDLRGVRNLLDDPGGGAAVVLGEAGMGKTALLNEIASNFAAEGVRTLRASGVQFESDLSYSALNQLLFGSHDAFDRLDEAHRTALRTALGFAAGPAPSHILVANAVLLLIRAIAAERALVLIVDDLHRVDQASARVLGFVSRRLAGSAVRFLGSARSGSAGCGEIGALPQYRLHPLTEQAARSLVGDALAPTVHRRVLAEAAGNPLVLLELLGALAIRVAEPDERVAALLEKSAELAHARGDSERAIASLARAAELSPEPSRRARRLALAAYLGADAAGEIDIAEQFAELARRHGGAPLLAVVASAMVLVNGDGDVRAAHDLLASAIENGDHGYDAGDRTLSEALHTLLFLSWYAGDPREWERCLALFARLQGRVEPSLAIESELLPDPARTDPAVASRLRTMLAGLPQETDPTYVSRVGGLAFHLDWEGAARDELWQVVRHARAGTAPMRRRVTALAALGFELFHTGRWKALEDVADEGAALCEEYGFTFIQWYFRYQRALLGATPADELLRWASARGAGGVERYARQAAALHHNGERDHAAAYRDAVAIAPAGTFPRFVPQALWAAFDLVEAAVHTGRLAEARTHAAAMGDLPVCLLSSRLALLSAGAAGMVAGDADVRDAFDTALSSPDAHRWPFEHGRIRLAYGERLRRMRATQEAREQLRAAAGIFRELPAPSWLERAESEIRATGLSRPRNGASRFTELTPKEWEIAELAASGMSNKEIGERLFLSHRTVGSHLYQIFPKLGLSSRAGLRDALLDLSERQRV